ncbi:hypothetical protein, partial [Alkalihalobacillus alcalophilus]|uniref:hypothetical protein n=1 Tax=Alkalihalobacillus alcalophilus TaxID=1445 RepID=UPI001B3B476F
RNPPQHGFSFPITSFSHSNFDCMAFSLPIPDFSHRNPPQQGFSLLIPHYSHPNFDCMAFSLPIPDFSHRNPPQHGFSLPITSFSHRTLIPSKPQKNLQQHLSWWRVPFPNHTFTSFI